MLAMMIAFHMLLSVVLIVLILIQRGKGAEIGAAFGSGASQTVFGSQGSASFLTRATAGLATLFFVSSLSLAWLYSTSSDRPSVTDIAPIEAPVQERRPDSDIPAVPRPPAQAPE